MLGKINFTPCYCNTKELAVNRNQSPPLGLDDNLTFNMLTIPYSVLVYPGDKLLFHQN